MRPHRTVIRLLQIQKTRSPWGFSSFIRKPAQHAWPNADPVNQMTLETTTHRTSAERHQQSVHHPNLPVDAERCSVFLNVYKFLNTLCGFFWCMAVILSVFVSLRAPGQEHGKMPHVSPESWSTTSRVAHRVPQTPAEKEQQKWGQWRKRAIKWLCELASDNDTSEDSVLPVWDKVNTIFDKAACSRYNTHRLCCIILLKVENVQIKMKTQPPVPPHHSL